MAKRTPETLPAGPLAEDPKHPLFVVRLRTCTSSRDGAAVSFGDEQQTTCHAPDEGAARDYVRQQNPLAEILSVEPSS